MLNTLLTGINTVFETSTKCKIPMTPSLLLDIHPHLDLNDLTFKKLNLFPQITGEFCSANLFTKVVFVVTTDLLIPDGSILLIMKH